MLSEQAQNQGKTTGGFLIEASPENNVIVESLLFGANRVSGSIKFTANIVVTSVRWSYKKVLSFITEKKRVSCCSF